MLVEVPDHLADYLKKLVAAKRGKTVAEVLEQIVELDRENWEEAEAHLRAQADESMRRGPRGRR